MKHSVWREMKLGEFLVLQRGHDLTDGERRAGSVPVFGSAGMNGTHDTALAKGPGVVVGRSGASFGQVHFSPTDFWPHNTSLYVKDFRGNDPRFTYYLLKSIDFSGYNSGSAQPSLNRNFVYPIVIETPCPEVQRTIARVLGAMDDKIELNRRMNRTLEELAEALFRSWFVDFDPVVAKAAGRAPFGLASTISALFPSGFTDSELGPIPHGWRVESIYTAATVIYGAPFVSAKFNTAGIGKPLIRIRDLPDDKGSVFTPEEHPKGSLVRAGDIVVGMDGEFRAYLWGGEESWLNQRLCQFRPKTGFSTPFVRLAITAPLADVEATELATTVIHLGKQDIDRFRFVCPPGEILTRFNAAAEPWYRQIVHNRAESRTLSALRDTLLPKLLSGELRVKDSERKAAAV
jgi:type I restriction enzyme S subunit